MGDRGVSVDLHSPRDQTRGPRRFGCVFQCSHSKTGPKMPCELTANWKLMHCTCIAIMQRKFLCFRTYGRSGADVFVCSYRVTPCRSIVFLGIEMLVEQ